MRTFILAAILMLIPTICMADVSISGLTDDTATAIKARLGFTVGDNWEVGPSAVVDVVEPEDIWGIGGHVKMVVNPGASIPIADWIGGLGKWLGLPETMEGSTYVICEPIWMRESGAGVIAIGPGVQVGPVIAEFLYRVVNGGDTDVGGATVESGAVLWFGARFDFKPKRSR